VLFVGDAASVLNPGLIDAAEKLLRSIGVSWMRAGEGQSSGYLPYTLGLWETARNLANQVVGAIEHSSATRVIALSPQDAHTIQSDYAEIGVALPSGVNVNTLTDVLANAGDKLRIKPRSPVPYTWHDATQSHRLKHHMLNARVLAATVMGAEPTEMLFREHLATPLSSGGLQFTQPALAEKLARTRIAEARATGAEIILTDDPLDTAILEKYAEGMTILNLYSVLADQLTDN
jgi:Fe-S oxidoreductase